MSVCRWGHHAWLIYLRLADAKLNSEDSTKLFEGRSELLKHPRVTSFLCVYLAAQIDGTLEDGMSLTTLFKACLPSYDTTKKHIADHLVTMTTILFHHPPSEVYGISLAHDVTFCFLELISSVQTRNIAELSRIAQLYVRTLSCPPLMGLEPSIKVVACVLVASQQKLGCPRLCGIIPRGMKHLSGLVGNEEELATARIAISAMTTPYVPFKRKTRSTLGSKARGCKSVGKFIFTTPSPQCSLIVRTAPRHKKKK